ncbi:MAG: trypsin-like peptidase domain-containing protein [Brevundimonas sp.]|uniref:S1 family peptidase n=1 Tax=Brevundimonas sp. TaxID=1871086 RepID=UPI0025BDDD1E|nr:serine protease [Brevundimonas sp.]MBX3476587.1 trypsin-like peptidase domain-containing protein [Brevundimonas sp.]
MWIQVQTPPQPPAPAQAAASTQAPARPAWDLTLALIGATIQLDQPDGQGTRTVGAGFLIEAPRPDGTPRTVLVTAAHVLNQMPGAQMRVGWRSALADGSWKFEPQPVTIRAADDQPLWTRHPDRDIAVMEITAPDAFTRAAIPLGWLADRNTLAAYQVGPGDELFSLGFPRGLSSNRAGFPILRVGRVASWPLSPVAAFPTFLLDFTVFPGNSGGPVFWTPAARSAPGKAEPDHPFIAGVLAQEVLVSDERLNLGVVVQAVYVREAIVLLDGPPWP